MYGCNTSEFVRLALESKVHTLTFHFHFYLNCISMEPDPLFEKALQSATNDSTTLLSVIEPRIHGVLTFPCFTEEFCDQI